MGQISDILKTLRGKLPALGDVKAKADPRVALAFAVAGAIFVYLRARGAEGS